MPDTPQTSSDMATAEGEIRRILATNSPGEAMAALLSLYEATPTTKRLALVAVLVTRVALNSRINPTREGAYRLVTQSYVCGALPDV